MAQSKGRDYRIPDYYKSKPKYVEDPIDYIEALGDMHGFCRGNIIKYVVRAGKKVNVLEDLYKAQNYLNRWIKYEEELKDNEYMDNALRDYRDDVVSDTDTE